MIDIPESTAPVFDPRGMAPAWERASDHARLIARQTGTPLVMWRNGAVVYLSPDDLHELSQAEAERMLAPAESA